MVDLLEPNEELPSLNTLCLPNIVIGLIWCHHCTLPVLLVVILVVQDDLQISTLILVVLESLQNSNLEGIKSQELYIILFFVCLDS